MRPPGFSLLEVLLALFIAALLVLAVASFYVQMTRAAWHGQAQTDLRRLAGRVQEEMARIIGPSVGLPPGPCGPPDAPAALPVQLPAGAIPDAELSQGGFVCFYRDPETDQLMRCRFEALGDPTCAENSQADLLGGVPFADSVRVVDLPDRVGTGLAFTRAGGVMVDVSFNLAVLGPGDVIRVGPVGFSTRFTVRN